MIRKYILPLLALAMLAFAVMHVVRANPTKPKVAPPVTPARNPFTNTVAGAGIVEAQTENIAIGSHLAGVVNEVFVQVGCKLQAGAPLFRVDDRQLQAELRLRQANLKSAEAQLARLVSMPRAEELPPSEARWREAQANLIDQDDMYKRAQVLFGNRAIGEEELGRRRQAQRMAHEQVARAKADFDLLKAGAWDADKAIARAAVELSRAQVEQTRIEIERLLVRASVEGQVLQVNVRPGEFVGAPPGQALVVLGNVGLLHVRVDIDENDIPRFRSGQLARGSLRGDPHLSFALRFVRVEPFVIPKKSLTGDNTERVDTRVLQVIYALECSGQSVYVGQQLDVFLDASDTSSSSHEP